MHKSRLSDSASFSSLLTYAFRKGVLSVNVYVKTLHKANITYNIRHTEEAADLLILTANSTYFNVIISNVESMPA